MSGAALALDHEVQIGLPWFHFVTVSVFKIDGQADEQELLATLLTTPQYEDAYEGPSGVGKGRHGPYPLEAIQPDAFAASTAEAVRAQIDDWFTAATEELDPDPVDPDNGTLPLDPTVEPMLNEHVFATLLGSTSVYELVLPESAEAPEWRTSRQNGFLEFVAISREKQRLTLLVCTDD